MIIDSNLSFESELIMSISFILYPSIYCIVTGKTQAAPFILICSILQFKSDEQIVNHVQVMLTIFFTVITIQLVSYIHVLSKQLQKARNELLHKNNFTCAIIHELRNPLNAVLGSLDVISQSLGDMQSSKIALIKNAQDSGEILSGMISNILDAGKIEAGKFDLNIEKIEVRKLVWKIVQVNKANAVRKGLSLEMQTDAAVPKYLQLDKCRTIQILMNLMSNAIKFTDEGGVKFQIS